MGRQIIVSHKHAVLLAIRISSQNFPVFREYFRCKFIIGIFQIFHRGHIANPTFCYREENNNACQCYQRDENPKDFYDFLYHVRFLKFVGSIFNNGAKIRKYIKTTLTILIENSKYPKNGRSSGNLQKHRSPELPNSLRTLTVSEETLFPSPAYPSASHSSLRAIRSTPTPPEIPLSFLCRRPHPERYGCNYPQNP